MPDGIPKWSGHKGTSEPMEEMSAEEGYAVSKSYELTRQHSAQNTAEI